MAKSPRQIAKMKFGSKNFYSRVKGSTLTALGIAAETTFPTGVNGAPIRGSVGAKHFTLKLKTATTDGKKTLSFPVDSRVPLKAAVTAFRKLDKVYGVVSPDGISYNWGQPTSTTGGGAIVVQQAALSVQEIADLVLDLAKLLGVPANLLIWASLGFKLLT